MVTIQSYTVPITIVGILVTLFSWSVVGKVIYNYYQQHTCSKGKLRVSPHFYIIISSSIFCFTCSTTVMTVMCVVFVASNKSYTYEFWKISGTLCLLFFGAAKMVLYVSILMRLYYVVQNNVLFNAEYFVSKFTMVLLLLLFLLCLCGYSYMLSDPLYGLIFGFTFDILFCLSIAVAFSKVLFQL
ncbi:hypothetical protein RFI_05001, partial [Reticulomyxa filosa]